MASIDTVLPCLRKGCATGTARRCRLLFGGVPGQALAMGATQPFPSLRDALD